MAALAAVLTTALGLVIGVAGLAFGEWPLLWNAPGLIVILLALLAWAVLRRRVARPRTLQRPPGPDWTETAERFVESGTGAVVAVWYHPATGRRAYVRHPG